MATSLKTLLATLVFSLVATSGLAQQYNRFGPVTGVLKGNVSSPQTSAATSADIIGLWTGTCSAATFLRGDGACAAGGVPSGAANLIYGTPNGSSGNATLRALIGADLPPINLASTASGGVLSTSILLGTNGGTSNGFFSVTGPTTSLKTFTFPNVSATVLTSNTPVTVAQGGTGVGTLTSHGVLLGEGTGNVSAVAAMSLDTVLQGQGASADPSAVAVNNCGDATHALSYNTTTHAFGCQAITSGGTGTVTSVAAGTGITASPSPIIGSGTISINQAFAPTWTGLHIFTPTAGVALTVNAPNNSEAMDINGSATTGQSFGPSILAGTNSSDYALLVRGRSGSTYFKADGAGSITVGAPTGGPQGSGTINAAGFYVNGVAVGGVTQTTGSFTLTVNAGCTTTPSVTATYAITGVMAIVNVPILTCTSNATNFVLSGFPVALQPNNGLTRTTTAVAAFDSAGTIASVWGICNSSSSGCTAGQATGFSTTGSSSNWTNTGTKGVEGALVYVLN